MDPEVVRLLDEVSTVGFNAWKETCSAEQKEVALAQLKKFTEDEEFKNAEMAVMGEQFTAADANADGVLDRDEYINFVKAAEARAAAQGNWIMDDAEHFGKIYAAANMITPGTDGLTMGDAMTAMGVMMKKTEELKAAAGL